MHNKVPTFQDTYLQILCHLVNSPIDEWEIHAKNYLLLFTVNQGGFPFHNFILEDVFISQFKRHAGVKRIAELYLSELQKTINHKQLTNYITNKLYTLLENEIVTEDYSEQTNIINQHLDALGSDEYFELGEIFSEDGTMRDIRSFEMTITERLMHNGWFNSNRVFSPKKDNLQSIFYKLFQDNLLLTWIKKKVIPV